MPLNHLVFLKKYKIGRERFFRTEASPPKFPAVVSSNLSDIVLELHDSLIPFTTLKHQSSTGSSKRSTNHYLILMRLIMNYVNFYGKRNIFSPKNGHAII